VVLQHQFWDLGVTEHSFEVGLSFGGVPERLLVPFEAITGFFDPSVQFGLKFEQHEIANEGDDEIAGDNAPQAAAPRTLRSVPDASEEEAPARGISATPKATGRSRAKTGEGKAADAAKADEKPEAAKETPKAASKQSDKDATARDGGAQVLSLDAFRKKT
jgi:hypothetical protein